MRALFCLVPYDNNYVFNLSTRFGWSSADHRKFSVSIVPFINMFIMGRSIFFKILNVLTEEEEMQSIVNKMFLYAGSFQNYLMLQVFQT